MPEALHRPPAIQTPRTLRSARRRTPPSRLTTHNSFSPSAPSPTSQAPSDRLADPLLGGGSARGQQHLEPGVARGRGDTQVAAVALHHDPPGDVEAEAGAL